jgi:dienelactone hydrolase
MFRTLAASAFAIATLAALPAQAQTTKEATWFSEEVRANGKLFLPAGFSPSGKTPGVVLAPAWGATALTLEPYASALAAHGIVALTIDYRGWGKSGGDIYLGERIGFYDPQRFTDQTPELVIRRGRLDPERQVQDIRNAITYLQSEAGIDPSAIGVLGVDIAGGHVISVMGMDTRVKAGVAVTPIIAGNGVERKSFIPDAKTQGEMVKLARQGSVPKTAAEAKARNAQEAEIALGEYMPFWRIDAVPQTDAVRFIVAGADEKVPSGNNAFAAAKTVKARNDVKTIEGAKHVLNPAQTKEAAGLAADWMKSNLKGGS